MPAMSKPEVVLRPFTAKEYPAYRARLVPTYADELTRGRGVPPDISLTKAEKSFPSTLDELLAEVGASLSRVLADGQDVGWLWLSPAPDGVDSLFIYDIEIDEAHRGRGLGRATMLAAEEVARRDGWSAIRLNVFGGNTAAESLYRSLGYETDSILMSKSLSAAGRAEDVR